MNLALTDREFVRNSDAFIRLLRNDMDITPTFEVPGQRRC